MHSSARLVSYWILISPKKPDLDPAPNDHDLDPGPKKRHLDPTAKKHDLGPGIKKRHRDLSEKKYELDPSRKKRCPDSGRKKRHLDQSKKKCHLDRSRAALSRGAVERPPHFAFALKLLAFVLALQVVFVSSSSALTDTPSLALKEGRADDAIHLLHLALAANPHDATAHQLLCRVYYAEDAFNPAIHECEAAVSNAPNASDNYLWLGRAYGMKASQVNPLSAFSLARKVVAAFEKAVALDPGNVAAMRDLGEYYVNAPGIVGGGLDKARALAQKMMPVSPTKAHRLLAQIAEKSGDYTTAEAEFKRAVDAQRGSDSLVDLAQFYLARKQLDQIAAPIQSAVRLDRPRDPAAVDAAAILISSDRSIPLAEQLLREYLASSAKSDAAPAFQVHVQLGDLLLKQSDKAGALREFDAALALASNYAPAKRARAQASLQTVSQVSAPRPTGPSGPQAPGTNAIP